MNVIRAKTAGFCMGVDLALKKLDAALAEPVSPTGRICTFGPIIHNPQVLANYQNRGVFCVNSPQDVHKGDVVVIRAHGIPCNVEAELGKRHARLVDATCPKVKKAQLAIANATANGACLLLFGEKSHPEVQGLVSYACGQVHVFSSTAELEGISIDNALPYVLASQTTQDSKIFNQIRDNLEQKLQGLKILATICDATGQRQEEAERIARDVDIMVVVGGRESGNTRRLADVAAKNCAVTMLVECAEELDAKRFAKNLHVGLTAGASTPKSLIDATQSWLEAI